nr:APH(3') family aminoglycoside O-phosphotransferase [uncultured Devosia sp.]
MPYSGDTPLPAALRKLETAQWTPVTIGKSGASVWRIIGDEALFLKSAPVHPLSELPGEAERLRWLTGTGLAAPQLRDFFECDGRNWLLMTAMPGADLTEWATQPELIVDILASSLRQLHALDIAACPFDHRLDKRLGAGADNVAAGIVDESDFDTAHVGWTAVQVLDWLMQNRPQTSDLVVTHGDVSLPNLMADNGRFSGFIDCGRLGVADRWQDLSIACRSLAFNCGPGHVTAFLAAYGAQWDQQRYDYYTALDELF